MLTIALLATAAWGTPTSLPFQGYLGDNTTSTCDSAWDGDCEVGWEGIGDDDALKLVQLGSTSNWGVRITPGSSSPNGIRRQFAVDDAYEYLSVLVPPTWTQDGSATLVVRAVFKNSAGTTLSTQASTFAVSCPTGDHTYSHAHFAVPTNAVTAWVGIGATGGSGSDPDVEMMTVDGMIPILLLLIGDSEPSCPSVECDEDISCPEGEAAFCTCDPGVWPSCKASNECWCEAAIETCHWE